MKKIFGSQPSDTANDESGHWLSVSDLMSGLMIVFLFIAVTYMREIQQENQKMKEVAIAYQDNQVAIYETLMKEFKNDLSRWNAEINKETLAFEFKSPDVLFDNGEIGIKSEFKFILDNFFPRYISQLRPFRASISEIRLEGHTSSVWSGGSSATDAYFKNMSLSQGRTRSVLEYIYALPKISQEKDWVKKHIAAIGFSSSKAIIQHKDEEDTTASRRVTFRVLTNAETQIKKILDN